MSTVFLHRQNFRKIIFVTNHFAHPRLELITCSERGLFDNQTRSSIHFFPGEDDFFDYFSRKQSKIALYRESTKGLGSDPGFLSPFSRSTKNSEKAYFTFL